MNRAIEVPFSRYIFRLLRGIFVPTTVTFDHPLAFLALLPALAAIGWLRRAPAWRAAAALCAVAAAAGPRFGAEGPPRFCRVYVLDGSGSVGGAAEALAIAKADAQDLDSRDLAAAVVVGEHALVELGAGSPDLLRGLGTVRTKAPDGGTRLGEGIDAAAGLVPAGARGEIVVISDGRESPADGSGALASALARRRGFAVRVLPCGAARRADARVDRVEAPGRVRAGERFEAVVTVSSSFPTRARVTLAGESREVSLEGGTPARFSFARPPVAGAIEWVEARVEPLDFRDASPLNNMNETPVLRDGTLPLLVLSPDAGRPAEKALAADPRFGVDWSARPSDLALYALVVLDGLPASDLGDDGARAIDRYVSSGGGLLVLGGPDGFGAGGYGRTPLDPALPVRCTPEEGFTLVVAIDASGSMNEDAAPGRVKIAEARDALRSLVAAARPGTSFAFVAFNTEARLIHPPTTDRPSLLRAVEKLDAGGKTALLPALDRAKEAAGSGGRRHIVLVSDGISNPPEDEEAIAARAQALRDSGATVSVIAEGLDANLPLLRKIAPDHVYTMADFSDLARLLREDLAREQGLTAKGPFAVPGRPDVLQVNVVEAKDDAETVLSASGRTLAAVRPHGRGRAAAFASTLDPDWLADRSAWAVDIAALAARVARPDSGGRLTLSPDGPDLVATWTPAAPGDEPAVDGELTLPDQSTLPVTLVRTASDRFAARVRQPRTGRFVLTLARTRAAAARPWPDEFAAAGPRLDLLSPLAGDPSSPPPPDRPGHSIAPWLLFAALAALLAEFAAGAREASLYSASHAPKMRTGGDL